MTIEENWQKTLAPKVRSAADAVRLIPRGCRILIGSGAAEPNRLVEAMVTEGHQLADNEVGASIAPSSLVRRAKASIIAPQWGG